MASSIFFNGRLIHRPGSYSEVDASGLETVGLTAAGIVAVLGEGEGGIPVSAITEPKDIQKFSTPEQMRRTFRSGPLREVSGMLFEPASDPDILGGAVQVVALKVNPATQSEATLDASGVPQIELTSVDYGAFTAQVNVSVAAGTDQGIALTITFEDDVIAADNLGGDEFGTLTYHRGTTGWEQMDLSISDSGNLTATGTSDSLGFSNLLDNPATNAAVEVLSSNVGDTTQTITIYGISGGVAARETLSLNGTTVVPGTTVWDAAGVLGVVISAAHAGTVTVRTLGGAGVNIFTTATGTLTEGVVVMDYAYVDSVGLSLSLDAAGTPNVVVYGKNASGSVVGAVQALNGTSVVTTSQTWSEIQVVVLGHVSNARTATWTARSARSLATVQKTLQKAADYFNSKQQVVAGPATRGFEFDVTTGKTQFLVENLDIQTDVDIVDPAEASLTADLWTVVDWINNNNTYITAEVASGATALPDTTTTPVYLSGGEDGVSSFSDYQDALDLLKQLRVNSVVDLSGDPAVAAALKAHCSYMCGFGRSERDGFVGFLNAAMTNVPTKAEALEQAVDLNTRHIRGCAQAVTRFNSAGEEEEFLPQYLAAIAAGAQAGAPVGTSLTFKFMNALDFRQNSSWNPTEDADEMIEGGVLILENVDGVGRRFVRNVTTHLSSDNLAFIEGSVNAAVNFAVFNFRTRLEIAVGKRGFSGTLAAARGAAVGILDLLVRENVITSYRALTLRLVGDVLDVQVELAPITPINFVRTTVHLRTTSLAA